MKLLSDINYAFENFMDRTSIVYCDREESLSFSFKDLKYASEIITLRLCSARKGRINVCEYIAVCTHLNYLYPIYICGILLSGRQFVCLVLNAPLTWNQNLIERLSVTTVVSTESCCGKLTQCFPSAVCVDEFDTVGVKLQIWSTGTGLESRVETCSMLYAIQTSGSTGHPKVVCVPEKCIMPNIDFLREEFHVTHEDVILSASPFTFDPSIVELFLAFTTGATLFMVSNNIKAIPNVYLDTLFPCNKSTTPITIIQMTPSVFCRWSTEDIKKRILSSESKLKILALGGEQFPQSDYFVHCRSAGNKTKIYNLYGTTEVSCWAMVSNEQDGCLGSPMSETILHVRDSNGSITTEGVGELEIGSSSRICVVDNKTELHTGEPVFRATGDLVHVSHNKYRYLGRKDNMIKRWGQRVSLDEIGTCALKHKSVSLAFCVLDRKNRLVLFVNNDVGLNTHLKMELKAASLPDIILTMPRIPLTEHGKVDKTILVKMANDHLELENSKTCKVLEYFNMLWNRYTNNACDTSLGFLDCGGNSISALQIITEMSFILTKIPTDLLNFLLQNNTMDSCFDLIRQIDCDNNRGNIVTRKQLFDNSEGTKSKKLKSDTNSTVCVQCRGQYFGEIEEKVLHVLPKQMFLEKTWSHDLRKCIDASPTLIHYRKSKLNLVTVGSHSGILAMFQLHDGRKLWERTLPDRIESSMCPTKDGKCGIVGCYDGSIYGIQLTSGKIVWSVKTEAMVKCTPLIVDDFAIVGSYDHHVYCIDTENGKVKWTNKTSASVFSSPLYSNKHKLIIIANLEGQVLALQPDSGKLQWNLKFDNPIFSTPVIVTCTKEDHLVLAEVNGDISCVSVVNCRKIWSFKAEGNIFSSLAFRQNSELSNHILFGCHDHNIYCVQATENSAELVWKTNVDSPVYSTPAVATFLPFVAIASTKGRICVLDIISGEIKCDLDLQGDIFSSPVVFESKIVVGCRNNILSCLTINF